MEINKLKLAIFISGRGSNMKAIIDACAAPDFPAEVCVVISNRPDAAGLLYAKESGIKTEVIDHKKYNNRSEFEHDLQKSLQPHNVDLIALAGFMRILGAPFVEQWKNQIINIHPSLLPDYKGTNTHERVLADGRTKTGCSVHFVVPEMDSGKVILQRIVPITDGDTPETLAQKTLVQEHIAYPQAIKIIASSL